MSDLSSSDDDAALAPAPDADGSGYEDEPEDGEAALASNGVSAGYGGEEEDADEDEDEDEDQVEVVVDEWVDAEALALEDDQFRQDFELDLSADDGPGGGELGPEFGADLKAAMADVSGTDTDDWRVVEAAMAPESVLPSAVVRQGAATARRYLITAAVRLRAGEKGENAYDDVVDGVEGGSVRRALAADRWPGLSRLAFASAPALAVARAGGEGSADDDSGSSRGGLIAGGVLGALALLAALVGVTVLILRGRSGGSSPHYFDAPPPAEASVLSDEDMLRRSDVEVGGGGRASNTVDYMDDPDSRLTSATDGAQDLNEFMEDPDSRLTAATDEFASGGITPLHVHSGAASGASGESSAAINKDVWGRGTGSDF